MKDSKIYLKILKIIIIILVSKSCFAATVEDQDYLAREYQEKINLDIYSLNEVNSTCEKAIPMFQDLITSRGINSYSNSLAFCYLIKERNVESIQLYQDILDNTQIEMKWVQMLQLGIAYLQSDDNAKALSTFKNALDELNKRPVLPANMLKFNDLRLSKYFLKNVMDPLDYDSINSFEELEIYVKTRSINHLNTLIEAAKNKKKIW